MLLYYLCYEICIISCTVHWKFLVTNLAKVNILLCYPKYRILSFHRKKHENYSIHYNNIPLNALCFDFRNWYRRSNISWPRSVRLLTTTRWPPLQFFISYTVMDIKDWTLHRAIEVKVPWLRAVPARQEWILPLKKLVHFFLGPWLLVCQFIDISNQLETTDKVSNIERIFLYNRAFYVKNYHGPSLPLCLPYPTFFRHGLARVTWFHWGPENAKRRIPRMRLY